MYSRLLTKCEIFRPFLDFPRHMHSTSTTYVKNQEPEPGKKPTPELEEKTGSGNAEIKIKELNYSTNISGKLKIQFFFIHHLL